MLARIVWDDENPDLHYQSRTLQKGWSSSDNPIAVYRFYRPDPKTGGAPQNEKPGDFRVVLSKPYDWHPAMVKLNGSESDFKYVTGKKLFLYNKTGWPSQAYISTSGNLLEGNFEGAWFRFVTLIPSDLPKVSGMTSQNTPWLVQHITCVTWDRKNRVTKHINSSGTKRGDVFWFLVTKEGEAYIPARFVRPA